VVVTPMSDNAGQGADSAPNIVIAIDGPAASGQSSTAHWVARRLGYFHLDSGALYRALTAAQLRRQIPPDDWTIAQLLALAPTVTYLPTGKTFMPHIDGVPVEQELRGSEVTQHVSRAARLQRVRQWVNEQVRLAARGRNVVVDGRDMGTVVFPDAALKVFLIADPWERARRRLVQQLGYHPTDTEIAEETDRLVQRDSRDATQSAQASDAVLIDTTYLTQEEQVERIVALARAVTHRPGATSAVDEPPRRT